MVKFPPLIVVQHTLALLILPMEHALLRLLCKAIMQGILLHILNRFPFCGRLSWLPFPNRALFRPFSVDQYSMILRTK